MRQWNWYDSTFVVAASLALGMIVGAPGEAHPYIAAMLVLIALGAEARRTRSTTEERLSE